MKKEKKTLSFSLFIKNNSLSIVFFMLFVITIFGQIVFGFDEYNENRERLNLSQVSIVKYLKSGHFLESTFENWESEFLQMGLLVWLTIFLKQKGSSESNPLNEKSGNTKVTGKNESPWPVQKGGIVLTFYKNSLTIALFLLFFVSFVFHFYGSIKDENETLMAKGLSPETFSTYITGSRFWFESFQNWQSEFLSVFAIIVLSIFLRQKGSSQSKEVEAPNSETGG